MNRRSWQLNRTTEPIEYKTDVHEQNHKEGLKWLTNCPKT